MLLGLFLVLWILFGLPSTFLAALTESIWNGVYQRAALNGVMTVGISLLIHWVTADATKGVARYGPGYIEKAIFYAFLGSLACGLGAAIGTRVGSNCASHWVRFVLVGLGATLAACFPAAYVVLSKPFLPY